MLSMFLFGCSADSGDKERIMIRVRDNSALGFTDCWLGAGPKGGATKTTAFGSIGSGDVSRYKHIDAVLANYRKIDIVADGNRYLDTIDFAAHSGAEELQPGWYTFAYDIVDGQAVLTFSEDPAP